MAITYRSSSGTMRVIYGLSSDSKPTTGVGAGSTFLETDTSVLYLYSGSSWVAGASAAALAAGSAIIGKVGIDQTTPGTTDSVSVATGQGAGATIGTTTDAVVAAGATGSLSAKLRAISRDIVANVVLAAGSAIIGKVGIDQTTPGTTNQVAQVFNITTIKASVTRQADAVAYAANDCFANSSSSPTAGGGTFTAAARASGGTGTITGAIVSLSAGEAFQGEIWIFDQAATATNDNVALSVSDSDILNLIGVIPFNTVDVNAANAISYVDGLQIDFTCVGTANLRFLVKVMAAFTPSASEVLGIALKVRN